MWIANLTSLINPSCVNYYTFNPSLLHYKNQLYLLAYRVIYYDLPLSISPWGVWNSNYLLFPDAKQAALAKYRSYLGPSFEIPLQNKKLEPRVDGEVDTTGLAMLSLAQNGSWEVKWNIVQVFPDEYNQDARIYKLNKELVIVYNVFEKEKIGLRYRTFHLTDTHLVFSEEKYLFDHRFRNCEKHCFHHYNDPNIIQYSLGNQFCNLVENEMQKTKCSFFDYLYQKYGQENVLISLATPPIPYKTHFLACGHAKIWYKRIPHFDFLDHIDTKKIKPHGKYIYFAFFYEYDETNHILRVSPLFIPSVNNSHLPYLLFMPIGLTRSNEKDPDSNIILSGGEGDVRLRIIVFQPKEIEYLLSTKSEPCFLTERLSIRHVGYFYKQNCGDDTFMEVFRYLYQDSPHEFIFSQEPNTDASLNVYGGGDIINSFFIPKPDTVPHKSITMGVGVPYEEFGSLLSLFQHNYVRSLQTAKTYPKCTFIPDLAFLLAKIWGTYQPNKKEHKKQIGIILPRTYYHPKYIEIYNQFVNQFATFIRLGIENGFQFVFIPFGINETKPNENDYLIINDITNLLPKDNIVIFHPSQKDYVREIYWKISQMDFTICSRFHAHIFSMIHTIPFISLTCGRKCLDLMNELPDFIYRLRTNEIDLPIGFNGTFFWHFFQQKFHERHIMHQKLKRWTSVQVDKLVHFTKNYLDIIHKFSKHGQAYCWLPPKKQIIVSSSPEWRLDHPQTEYVHQPFSGPEPNPSNSHPPIPKPTKNDPERVSEEPKTYFQPNIYYTMQPSVVPYQPIEQQQYSMQPTAQPYSMQPVQPQQYATQFIEPSIPQTYTIQPIQPRIRQTYAMQPIQPDIPQTYTMQPIQHCAMQPIQHIMQPIQHIMQPIQHTMQPIQHTMQPIQHTMQPIQHTMQPIQHTMQPIQYTMQQHTMQPMPSILQPICQQIMQPIPHSIQMPMMVAQSIMQAISKPILLSEPSQPIPNENPTFMASSPSI
jgi:hypothetical protein